MLIVNPQKYNGRFHEKAKQLVLSGTRVGKMWVGPDDVDVLCHVCKKNFPKPAIDKVENDAWGECPHCKTPFVFVSINWKRKEQEQ